MATQVNVREIILETLLLITRDGEYSHIALKNVLDKYQYLENESVHSSREWWRARLSVR